MNLEKLTLQVCDLAREVAIFQHQEISKLRTADIQRKGLHNYVTYVDKESEHRIVERLLKILPGSGFIAEENKTLKPSEFTWVIDPLDGTTNFIHGIPLYCISIGLIHGVEPILGVVYESNLEECFYTWKSSPSFLNQEKIQVSDTPVINESLLATGFPYYDYHALDDYLVIFKHLLQNSRGLRRLGSAAADLAWVACGRFDGFYEYGLSPWDVTAGGLLVKNAGGKVSDFRGTENHIFGKQIIATNGLIYGEFLKLFDAWKHESN
ncbi:MAG: inositol monophosphatase [Bacteroidales bacterium]|jgi:myo-inositol-1(or 4)-monophosphatase|nr:inositol monophosphatase [Bacteroidales bacterium]